MSEHPKSPEDSQVPSKELRHRDNNGQAAACMEFIDHRPRSITAYGTAPVVLEQKHGTSWKMLTDSGITIRVIKISRS